MAARALSGRVWLLVLAALAFTVQAGAHDWPQFRGMNRDGRSAEKGLLSSWPDGGPTEAWRVPLGQGYSGIAVVGDRIFTMYSADHEGSATEFAASFDAKAGKLVWRVPLGEKFENSFGNGPRSTPTVDGDRVYFLDSHGTLVALTAKDGAEQWRMSLTETFGSKVPTFGFSTSALVDGDQLLIEGGGKEGKSYAGLNKKTGEINWTVGDGPDDPSYNSPIAVTIDGKKRYVYVVGDKMTCIDPKGNEIWSHPWTFPGETHAMPIFIPPNQLYASGAEGVGASLLTVSEEGGEATIREVWKTNEMRNHFSSAVVHDGYIYGFDNATLRAISVADGETAWRKRGLGKGSLIYADGHLVVLSDQGKLLLVEATPESYKEKGSVQALEGRCWTAPTLADGKLYLRSHEVMVQYDLER